MSAIAFPIPDQSILARREEIVSGLARLVAPAALITAEDERRPYETDALTAYRRLPLAVVLPSTTAEVAAVLKFCGEQGVPVVPRGAGTSLAGGAIPQEDAVVIGVSKMNRILQIDYANRTAKVQAGVTNLAVTGEVSAEGFFYAPDPSSQLACSIGGNIGMNSGGAHCLKYGVTTNNVLGVTMVLLDGSIVEVGGAHLDSAGYDILGLINGSEGQLGIITEATVRILRAAEGARPVLFGFPTSEQAGAAVAAIIGAGIIPGRDGVHGQARHRDLRGLRPCRLSDGCRGAADHRGRGLGHRDGRPARPHRHDCPRAWRQDGEGEQVCDGGGRDLEGPQIRLRRDGPHRRLHLHGRHHPHRPASLRAAPHGRDREGLWPARRQCLPRG